MRSVRVKKCAIRRTHALHAETRESARPRSASATLRVRQPQRCPVSTASRVAGTRLTLSPRVVCGASTLVSRTDRIAGRERAASVGRPGAQSHSHKPELARGFRPCPLERVGAPVRLYSRLYCLLCTSRSFGLQWCLWLTQTKQRICEKIAPRDAASGLRLQAGRSGAGGVGINQSFLSRSDLYVGAVTSAPASARPGGMCARTGPYVQRLATASSLS